MATVQSIKADLHNVLTDVEAGFHRLVAAVHRDELPLSAAKEQASALIEDAKTAGAQLVDTAVADVKQDLAAVEQDASGTTPSA